MKIAVLSCGPSLTREWSEDLQKGYDLTLGVNTASWVFRTDLWAYLDKEVYLCFPKEKDPPMTILTHRKMVRPLGSDLIEMELYNRDNKELPPGDLRAHAAVNCNYTFPCALHEAKKLSGGGEVHIYGFDMAVHKHCVGNKGGDRGTSRWMREFPWVKMVWQNHWKVFGDLPSVLLECLNGNVPIKEAYKAITG